MAPFLLEPFYITLGPIKISEEPKYIKKRKVADREFATGFEEGYQKFRIGITLREARKAAGLTQEELARRIKTKKTAVSRIENHSRDIRISTLEKVALALGKRLQIRIL
jgi:ribosome-binding protein aMBF1 (putative translation factor)